MDNDINDNDNNDKDNNYNDNSEIVILQRVKIFNFTFSALNPSHNETSNTNLK